MYLQAVVENAPALNLLSGKANIYFDNRYIGQTYIDSGLITNELELPFGMNKDIQVSRKVDSKLTKQRVFWALRLNRRRLYDYPVIFRQSAAGGNGV